MNYLLPTLIIVPVLAALLSLAGRSKRLLGDIIALSATLYSLVVCSLLYFYRPYNNVIVSFSLVLDGFSHLVLLLTALIGFLVVIYSVAYKAKDRGKNDFYSLFLLLLAGVNGLVLAGDLMFLFFCLELAALAAYALVAFDAKKEGLEASWKYLVLGEFASLLILLAIGIVYAFCGTFNLAQVAGAFQSAAPLARNCVILLFLAGFGMKAALVPFHSWLADAHSSAPSPVSAMLSGVIIKALGVYALVRILYNAIGVTPQLSYALMVLGVISILIGVLLALGQWDFKRLLAYHSVSQVGYIVLGIGLGTPLGILGGLFHLFNHTIFKSLLFLNAGAVEYSTGTRNLKEMGGLYEKLPVTSRTSLIASFSIAGVPPFNGFWSKLFVIIACAQAGRYWFALAAVLGSVLTLASFAKVQKYGFFEKLPPRLKEVKESPWPMGLAMIVLAALCLLVGVFFAYVINFLINPAVIALANGLGYGRLVLGGR